jgi:hypothetical protein
MKSTTSKFGFSKGLKLFTVAALAFGMACSGSKEIADVEFTAPTVAPLSEAVIPTPDPRQGLSEGLFDAEEAIWNLKMVSQNPPPADFLGKTNSDLAFKDNYVIQGNYNGVIIWDVTDPANPVLVKDYVCPASQSDVSVYGNLLFVSGEGRGGRLDCGTQGVQEAVSKDRLRGIRIFDISDINNPVYVSNVQTCRGSHTHSVLKDPNDDDNVYVYISGSAGIRPEEELPGCSALDPDEDPNTALFRIEVIKVPLDSPEDAAIVSSPRIFEDLEKAPQHGLTDAEKERVAQLKAAGQYPFIIETAVGPFIQVANERLVTSQLARIAEENGRETPTAEDSTYLRENMSAIVDELRGIVREEGVTQPGPDQCHDITLYPEIGLAGGACEGYGLLLDITDPANPVRIDAVADSNFSYWHSATFSNDGSKVLFTDEWGGGGAPKCQETDPYEWGANAIFSIVDGKMEFESYYKVPGVQSAYENCVAHNGSLIPVPGRDIMVQSWYQGGISVFDWTDAGNPVEIAFHDRGPVSTERGGGAGGGSWSVYWYNGYLYNSEIARGLDVFELTPSAFLTENEIAAANTVQLDYLNAQGNPMFVWPDTYALAKAYTDQLHRDEALSAESISMIRQHLANAETYGGKVSSDILNQLAEELSGMASESGDPEKVSKLIDTVRNLASS